MTRGEKLLILLFLLCFGIVVTGNAWLSDDAYITFRTVDNFVNGYGLTWNVAERVQAYTHPLWMFLLSSVYLVTHEAFFSSQVLSIAISLAAVLVLAACVADSWVGALLGIAIFTLSRAFVDYSTSGLENPLTHLILAIFLWLYFRKPGPSLRVLFFLSLLAALGTLNRMDTALLFLPALAYRLVESRQVKGLYAVIAGFAPVLLWELFSLFYYGALFPNTALAKLNVGLITRQELAPHGLYYLLNSIQVDPLTLVVIVAGIGLPFVLKAWRALPVAAGIALYLLYVVSIGGDFMSGRFLSAPLLAAVAVLVSSPLLFRKTARLAFFAPVVIIGLIAPRSPLLTLPMRNMGDPRSLTDDHGISDERANYYRNTGLLMAFRYPNLPDHDWALEGRAARLNPPAVVEKGSIGFYGYFAGPQVYVVDLVGLADPLMARLPPTDPNWRIGHLGRTVPDGYLGTLASGENKIKDKNLAAYYGKLAFVIRGRLFDVNRLVEVWRLNTGAYDHYLDAYAYSRGETFTQQLQVANPGDSPYVYAYVWNNGAAEAFLLDDASQRGKTYTVKWNIAVNDTRFEGPYKQHVASIKTLSQNETLNVGVYFSAGPDASSRDMFERRFWFRLQDAKLLVVLPGAEWHNSDAPQGVWVSEDIDGVMTDAPGLQ